jgi:hypothetical protein
VTLNFVYDIVTEFKIKSGKEGKLKSLHQFIEVAPHPYAVRMYAVKFSIEEHSTRSGKKYFLMNIPYYLSTKLTEYLSYFVTNFKRLKPLQILQKRGVENRSLNFTNKTSIESINTGLFVSYSTYWA